MADDDDDEPVELTVRLPTAMVRRIEALTPGARLPDVLRQAVVAMVEIAEREQEAVPAAPDDGREAGAGGRELPPPEAAVRASTAGSGDATGGEADPALPGAAMPVLAVGDAAEVLGRLDGLTAVVAGLRDSIAANEERERVTQVWIKTTLAELFVHTTPFPSKSDERRRREEAAERLARVDERVRGHVRNGRDAAGAAGETPATG